MRKYFLYELKKARWQLIIISAIFTILFGTIAAVMKPQTPIPNYADDTVTMMTNPTLNSLIGGAMNLMCFIAPVLVYQFKMNKRTVDCYYALPLKKQKLYFVKTLVGLLLVLIPFTIAYWATFLIILIKPNNPYNMGWFVPTYFGMIFFALCLYGFNAFAFTRGNSIVDGIALMIGYQEVLLLVVLLPWIWSYSHQKGQKQDNSGFRPPTGRPAFRGPGRPRNYDGHRHKRPEHCSPCGCRNMEWCQ